MKNYILIIVLSCVVSISIDAQEKGKVIFRENFDNNNNNWDLQAQKWEHAVHPSRYIATIRNGAYHIKAMTKGIFKRELGLNRDLTNYTLETAIRLKLTTENGLFYLRWKEENELYYFFGLNKNGNYQLATNSSSYYNFGNTTIKEGQIPQKYLRKTNVLKIEAKSSVVSYYINDYLLYSFFNLGRSSNPQPLDKVDFLIFNPDRGIFELFGGSIDYLEIRENNAIESPAVMDTLYNGQQIDTFRNAKTNANIKESIIKEGKLITTTGYTQYPVLSGDSFRIVKKALPIKYDTIKNDFVENWENYKKKKLYCTINPDLSYVYIDKAGNCRVIRYSWAQQVIAAVPTEDSLWVFDTGERQIYIKVGNKLKKTIKLKKMLKHIPYKIDHMDISEDRKVLLIQNELDDIFISRWNNLIKNYGKPFQLNMKGERPCFGSDGKSIYFSSKNHYRKDIDEFSNNDILVTERLDENWKVWSSPKGVGSKINTAKYHEQLLNVTKGELIFYDKKYHGHLNLYKAYLQK